jgi:hypothetical protein
LESQTLFSGFAAGDVARRIYFSLIPMLMALTAAGCGAPAEPSLRRAPVPESVPDLSVRQSGNDVILTFTVPRRHGVARTAGASAQRRDLSGIFRGRECSEAGAYRAAGDDSRSDDRGVSAGRQDAICGCHSARDAGAARRAARRLPGAHASVAEKIVRRFQPRIDTGLSAGRGDPRFGGDPDEASGGAAVDAGSEIHGRGNAARRGRVPRVSQLECGKIACRGDANQHPSGRRSAGVMNPTG